MTIIKSSEISYLNEAVIEKYRNVKVVSAERMSIRINLLILCAMSPSLKMEFDEDDIDHTIITEFSLEEIKQVKEFCFHGSCNAMSASVLEAFGFLKKGHVQLSRENLNENTISIASLPTNNSQIIKPELLPKIEIIDDNDIKEEHVDYLDDNIYEYENFLEDIGGSDDFLTSVIEQKEEEGNTNLDMTLSKKSNDIDDNSDNEWKPPGEKLKTKSKKNYYYLNKGKPKKEKVGRPIVNHHELSEKDLELYKTFELPKPLEKYISKPKNLKGLIRKAEENKNDLTLKYQCTVCQWRLQNITKLKAHEIRHHNEHISCQICSAAYHANETENFKKHMFYHLCLNAENYNNSAHAQRTKRLMEAKQKKSLIPKIKKKQKPAKKVVGICYVCGLDSKNLRAHITEAHPINNERPTCSDCGKEFPSKTRLGRHFRRVHQKVQCQQCGEIVTNLYNHVKTHVSIYDRPHKCELCGKGFWYKNQLEEHKNVHTGEKTFKCKYCPSAFGSQGSRDMHQKGHLGIKRKSK